MRKDIDHVKKNHATYYDDLDSTARYLEKMAKNGWMLEKVTSATQFHFVKSEPKDLRFAVEIFSEGSVFDTHTIDSNLEYVEYCKKAGWNFICSAGNLDFFYTEDKNAPEIESDQAMKLHTIEKAQRFTKLIFPIIFLLMSLSYMTMQLTMNLNALETSFLHFSAIMLWVAVGLLYVVILISYLIWRRKARKAVKQGEKIPANKGNLSFRASYGFLLLFGILQSAITVWVGLQYQERSVLMIPMIWIFMLLIILLGYRLSAFAEKKQLSRGMYKLLGMVVIPVLATAFLLTLIVIIIFGVSSDNNNRRSIDPMDMKAFGDSQIFVRREGSNHHWGHFLLSFDQYTLEAYNADRVKMLEDEGYQKTGVYQIRDGESNVPVTYTWSFDVYQTKVKAIYDRILREAKEGKDERMLSIRFEFDKAMRLPEMESDGINVWIWEETFMDDGSVSYHYLITDEDTIINARCDAPLDAEQMQIIERSFME